MAALTMKPNMIRWLPRLLACTVFTCIGTARAETFWDDVRIHSAIQAVVETGEIPNLTIVFVDQQGHASVHSYPPDDGRSLDANYELASCSKSFTGLAILKLESEGKLRLDQTMKEFFADVPDASQPITVAQLLHHTSGIAWKTMDVIQPGTDPDALQRTARAILAQPLGQPPAQRMIYATGNYDILGAIVEKVSGKSFEDYMQLEIFPQLGMARTYVGTAPKLMPGYKIGFGRPLNYTPPVYRGNYPAGYITSNAQDMAQWLKFNLQHLDSPLGRLLPSMHEPDRSVPPNRKNLSSYAAGWEVLQQKSGIVFHDGLNPNFTSFIGLLPKDKVGFALLANSNSDYTYILGNYLLNVLQEWPAKLQLKSADFSMDRAFTALSVVLLLAVLANLVYLGSVLVQVLQGRSSLQRVSAKAYGRFFMVAGSLLPIAGAIWLLPKMLGDVGWAVAIVWQPLSFEIAIYLLALAAASALLCVFVRMHLTRSGWAEDALFLLGLVGAVSGIGNAFVIFIVSHVVSVENPSWIVAYYFVLSLLIYVFGRRFVEMGLLRTSYNMILKTRLELIDGILSMRYDHFARISNGRIFSTLTEDVETVGQSANHVVTCGVNVITVFFSFFYLMILDLRATAICLVVIAAIASLYSIVSRRADEIFDKAREAQTKFSGRINDLIQGFRLVRLHAIKRKGFQADLHDISFAFQDKRIQAYGAFVDAFILGESLLIIVLGAISFGLRSLFPDISIMLLGNFAMVLLYLLGPINGILAAVPHLTRIRVSQKRVANFRQLIACKGNPPAVSGSGIPKQVKTLEVRNLCFRHQNEDGQTGFEFGPINLSVHSGDIVFIIGGNGSGKTTLANLVTGLFAPSSGSVFIDGKPVTADELGEYFGPIFSDTFLFRKLYGLTDDPLLADVERLLDRFKLRDKVTLENKEFNTVDLSTGQKKRLALIVCILENRPIFLFDEWAADQDPSFRKFFYREFLPELKKQGKLVIAITHDDHYFDVATKIVKLDMGKIDQETDQEDQGLLASEI